MAMSGLGDHVKAGVELVEGRVPERQRPMLGKWEMIGLMAALIHARMQGGRKGAEVDVRTAVVLYEELELVMREAQG